MAQTYNPQMCAKCKTEFPGGISYADLVTHINSHCLWLPPTISKTTTTELEIEFRRPKWNDFALGFVLGDGICAIVFLVILDNAAR